MDVFVSWSGGKDCCLACYRAIKSGHNVRYLSTMIMKDINRMHPHHFRPELIDLQAEAIGIPLMKRWAEVSEYKARFIDMLRDLKKEGITAGVFGDVSVGNSDSEEHINWIESVCQPAGIEIILPLWNQDRESLIRDVIDKGFEAVIIAADKKYLGPSWLGRKLDNELLSELKTRYDNSHDGKVGYYHTLVLDGPIFKKRLHIAEADVVLQGPIWFLDITKIKCLNK